MRIDLPCCNFKNCNYSFDGNCLDKRKYERCEYIFLKESYENRPTGHWIYHPEWEEDGGCPYECSECGVCYDYKMNFCGKCGCKMKDMKQ